jgi:hypothetical protein
VDRGVVPRINGRQEKVLATRKPRYEKKLSNISYAFHNFMTLSFARSSGSILTLCSGLAKLRCGGELVVDMSRVYHQHSMHFISHLCLSYAKYFILMSSTSFDEFVREGAHR